jgi:lysozyme
VGAAVLASVVLAAPAAALTLPALRGIDISSYQHQRHATINWHKVAATGVRFAGIKATEGTYYVNPFYGSDVRAALRAGLYVAPYVFANPHDSGGAREAKYAVEHTGYRWAGRMLPLELDVEPDPYARKEHVNACYGLSRKKMVAWIGAFAAETRKLTGGSPLIYTDASWWYACTGGSGGLRSDPLWVAAYGTKRPEMPEGWPRWTFWQYQRGVRISGVGYRGGVDVDFGPRMLVELIKHPRRFHRHHKHHHHRRHPRRNRGARVHGARPFRK